jgi:hypothetical protein
MKALPEMQICGLSGRASQLFQPCKERPLVGTLPTEVMQKGGTKHSRFGFAFREAATQ